MSHYFNLRGLEILCLENWFSLLRRRLGKPFYYFIAQMNKSSQAQHNCFSLLQSPQVIKHLYTQRIIILNLAWLLLQTIVHIFFRCRTYRRIRPKFVSHSWVSTSGNMKIPEEISFFRTIMPLKSDFKNYGLFIYNVIKSLLISPTRTPCHILLSAYM